MQYRCELYKLLYSVGVIEKIHEEDDKEQLQIRYNTERTLKVIRGDSNSIRPLSSALSIYKYIYDAIGEKNKSESMAISNEHSIPCDQIKVRRG